LAALLHDTVEDTTTDYDDLAARFGNEVADWVAVLSKDKRLPEPEREETYANQLAGAGWQVRVCKLADVYDNLMDSQAAPLDTRDKVLQNARRYLKCLKSDLPEQAQGPWIMVSELLAGIEAGK
jgi:(p)ppGpp synthase/HD superfamily hydrolase